MLAALVMLGLFIGGGVVYTLMADNPGPTKAAAPKAQEPLQHTLKPVQPAANAPEGVAVGSLTTPVKVGTNASIIINTNAGSTCSISVIYNSGVPSTDSGLAPKLADAYGVVSWSWTVPASTPPGNWPVKVTCLYHGRSGVVEANLVTTM